MHTAYVMFNAYIYLMEVVHQKRQFFGFIEQFITNSEECNEMLVMCEKCKQKYVLSNYSKDTSDDITKVVRNLSQFHSCMDL